MAKKIITLVQEMTTPTEGGEVKYRRGGSYHPFTSTELPGVGGGGTATLQETLTEGNDAGGLGIVNMLDPVLDQDAATKKYVDDNAGVTNSALQDFIPKTDADGNLVATSIKEVGALITIDEKAVQMNQEENAIGLYFDFRDPTGVIPRSNLRWSNDPGAMEIGSNFSVYGYKLWLDNYLSFHSENDTTLHVGNTAQNLNLRTGAGAEPGDPEDLMINGVPGATGTFTSQDGKTITVTKGIITGIV